MKTKANPPLDAFAGQSLKPLAAAYFELDQLKLLYRQGWLKRGVPPGQCESVADHVYAMTMLAWWIIDAQFPNLNRDKVMRMVLAHELGEIYAGDLIPGDNITPGEKYRCERAGLWQVVGKLPRGEEYLALWEEFEAGQTPEARFTRQIDRLEMAFQARAYESQGYRNMAEFYATASAALEDPLLRQIFEELRKLE